MKLGLSDVGKYIGYSIYRIGQIARPMRLQFAIAFVDTAYSIVRRHCGQLNGAARRVNYKNEWSPHGTRSVVRGSSVAEDHDEAVHSVHSRPADCPGVLNPWRHGTHRWASGSCRLHTDNDHQATFDHHNDDNHNHHDHHNQSPNYSGHWLGAEVSKLTTNFVDIK